MSEENYQNYNVIPNAVDLFSRDTQLSVYQKMAEARIFEEYIVKVASSGKFSIKIHMSSGQEGVGAAIGEVAWDYQIFTQHRAMDLFLSLGGPVEQLRDEIMCLDTGCCGGKIGGAFQYFGNGRRMYAHTGLIGENISVGVGAALGNGEKTLCFFGDGAAEEDYALSAFGFAATHKLPVLFICTDNDLSVLSPKSKRRSWSLVDVAKGFGLQALDLSDDPFTLMHHIQSLDSRLPALINCHVCRNYWHAGVGIDNPPPWDRYHLVRSTLIERGLEKELQCIDEKATEKMEAAWKAYL